MSALETTISTAVGAVLGGGIVVVGNYQTARIAARRDIAEWKRRRTDIRVDDQRAAIIELQDRFAELLVDAEALGRSASEARMMIAGRPLQFGDIPNWDRVLRDYSRCRTLRTRLEDEELRRLAAVALATAGRIIHDPVSASPELILPASDAVEAFNARCIDVFATQRLC